jgi:ABC-type nitrate/sulfonate/bicarbonate transport system substrate-binding protein
MMVASIRRLMIGAAAAATILSASCAALAQSSTLKVMVFPGISNLSLFAAQSQGFFGQRGLEVKILNTRSSDELRAGLANGHHQIAHAGVDNAIAMVELANADAAVVIGGHAGFGHVFLQKGATSYEDVRGKTVVVDAPNTAYALVLYKILQNHGLKRGDYAVNPAGGTALMLEAMLKDKNHAAAILSPPFAFKAEREGLKDLGPAVKAIGAYQFDAGFVLRSWARANADTLVRYIAAYVDGCRWSLDPANRTAAIALLVERLKLPADDAMKIYEIVADPVGGFAKDAKVDVEGFKNTLKLRAEIEGQWGGTPPSPDKYLDLTYYDRAVAAR